MRLAAVPVYLTIEMLASAAFMVTFTITNVYFVTEVGMSPLQLVLCGTAMELTVFLFEVPTGVVADTVSRRLSVVISYGIVAVAMVLFGVLTSAPLIIAAYALWGLGWTFQSGAYEAWIHDEVGSERYTRVRFRGEQFSYVGALAGIGLGTLVAATVDLQAAIVAGGVGLGLLTVFLALTMPETGFTPHRAEDGSTGPRALARTARDGARLVRGHHLLLLMLAIAFAWGMWSESFDRLWQAQLITDVGFPSVGGLSDVVWVGILTAAAMVVGLAINQVAGKRLADARRARLTRVLLGANSVLLAAALLFALAGEPVLAIAAYVAITACRSLVVPLQSVWVNQTIEDSSVRATVISITNQADAIGQVTGGPAIGAVGSAAGLRPALALGAAALAPVLALYGRASRSDRETTATDW